MNSCMFYVTKIRQNRNASLNLVRYKKNTPRQENTKLYMITKQVTSYKRGDVLAVQLSLAKGDIGVVRWRGAGAGWGGVGVGPAAYQCC